MTAQFSSPHHIRGLFSQSMSDMYRREVPQYGTLLDLVADINERTLNDDPGLRGRLAASDEMERLSLERHGAIRLGTAQELADIRRIFRVMGMFPVGYYDLSVAGVPVHSTAFRPIDDDALRINPFRVFTSLLRLELIRDPELRQQAQEILARRRIFTPRALELTRHCETQGGLTAQETVEFVQEVTQTFRWHHQATVSYDTYRQLHAAHRLVADVVSFKGPHINHLTPRTLDIDAAQAEMPKRGIVAKEVIEGPPKRRHPILLRQTSFKALEEAIAFSGDGAQGAHTARFGEIEQRGAALTRKGRALYDQLLGKLRSLEDAGRTADHYDARLAEAFQAFPDDLDIMHEQQLAFFRYAVRDADAFTQTAREGAPFDLGDLLRRRIVDARPITYEDFLPVSAAGIFQSNLGEGEKQSYTVQSAKDEFESALQTEVADEIALYESSQQASLATLQHSYLAAQGR